jgi:hypothetical protein
MGKSKSSKSKSAPSVCNLLLPVDVEHLKGLADKMVNGDKLTVAEVNGGRIPADEVEKRWGLWDEETEAYSPGSMNEALYAGKAAKNVPTVPAVHQPVLLLAAKSLGMTFAGNGQASRNKTQPSNWPSHLGAWKEGRGIAPAFGRAQALKDVRRNVEGDGHLVTIGTTEYVIGDDKHNALDIFHGSKGENTYGFNVRCLKRLAFHGRDKQIANIVFQVNRSAMTVPWTGDRTAGTPLVMLPNMVATAGHLYRNGKVMTYKQIAAAVEKEDTKGISFRQLSEPIVGETVSQAALVAAVKKSMSAKATADDKGKTAWERFVASQKPTKGQSKEDAAAEAIWYNATVQTRNNPTVLYCFGLRNSVIDQPLAIVYGDDRTDKRITCIVGLRCGDALTFNSREALRGEEEEAEEAEAPEPKAEKPKPKKKGKKGGKKRQSTKKVTEPEPVIDGEPAAEITDASDDEADAADVDAEADAIASAGVED